MRCRCAGQAGAVAHFVQSAAHLGDQVLEAAMQAQAAADFDQQSFRWLQAHGQVQPPAQAASPSSDSCSAAKSRLRMTRSVSNACAAVTSMPIRTPPVSAASLHALTRTVALPFNYGDGFGYIAASGEDFQRKHGEMYG